MLLNVADGSRIQLFVGDEPLDLCDRQRRGSHERIARPADRVLTRTVRWRSPGGPPRRGRRRAGSCRFAGRTSRRSSSRRALDRRQRIAPGRIGDQCARAQPGGVRGPAGRARTARPRARCRPSSARPPGDVGRGRAADTRHPPAIAAAAGPPRHVDARGGRRTVTAADDEERRGVASRVPTSAPAPRSADEAPRLLHLARPPRGDAGRPGAAPSSVSPSTRLRRRSRRAARGARPVLGHSDVEIDGDGALQQGVRFNLFSLFQAAGRDGRTSLAAKGLTGEGYEGHYFWDTEIFALPFFAYTQPAIARALLRYRCGIARQGARTRGRDEPARGPLPVADDRRRRGVGLLPRGHGAVPHRRRHRLRDREVRRARPATGRCSPKGAPRSSSRPRACGRTSATTSRPGRRVLHQRGHRPRRVHGARQQQLLHEPDGAGPPPVRGAPRGRARGRGARGVRQLAAPARPRAGPRWRSGVAPPTRCASPAMRPSAIHAQDDSFLARAPGLRDDARFRLPAAAALSTRS